MAGTNRLVLVVDDEPAVRRLAATVLGRRGFTVLEADDGPSALEAAGEADGPIELLLTDVVLPGMKGDELAAELRAHHPGLRVVFMSGFEEDELSELGIGGVGAAYVTKPFTADVLTLMIEGALS